MVSGIAAGFCTSTVTNPIWVVKTRLQLEANSAHQYNNAFRCALAIWRAEGPKAFTKGLGISYLGISEGTLQWMLFEAFSKKMRSLTLSSQETKKERGLSWTVFPASMLAKLIATLATYPHEVNHVDMVLTLGRPNAPSSTTH